MLQDIIIIYWFYARIIHSFVYATFCLIILFVWAHVSIIQLLGIMLLQLPHTSVCLDMCFQFFFFGKISQNRIARFYANSIQMNCITLIMICNMAAPPYYATNIGLISSHPFQLWQHTNIWNILLVSNYEFHG